MTLEQAWWDHWNIEARTRGFSHDCAPAKTGLLALREICALGLDTPEVLEVGCGTGWLAGQMAGPVNYLGLDLSPAAVAAATSCYPSARFLVADFHEFQGPASRFDVVVMVDTIAYFRDQTRAVTKTRDLLKRPGWLVLTTVNPFVYSRLSWVGPPAKGQVRHWLTRSSLRRLLTGNGFEVTKCYTVFPAGNTGLLRILNSRKLSRLLLASQEGSWLDRCKERLGLGQYRVAVARVRESNTCR